MSIRTYFENIADAIKNVYGTTDTLTPAEMPRAITNFNSIFQTKELSSPIGTETTVEGCLSSLSSDLSDLTFAVSTSTTASDVSTLINNSFNKGYTPYVTFVFSGYVYMALLCTMSPNNNDFYFANILVGQNIEGYNLRISGSGTSVRQSINTTITDITSNISSMILHYHA